MKASELIKYLTKFKKENGDIEVRLPSELIADSEKSDTTECVGIATLLNSDDTPAYGLLCDHATMDSLS